MTADRAAIPYLSERDYTADDCSVCGKSWEFCNDVLSSTGGDRTCCGTCKHTATHNQDKHRAAEIARRVQAQQRTTEIAPAEHDGTTAGTLDQLERLVWRARLALPDDVDLKAAAIAVRVDAAGHVASVAVSW